MPYLLEPLWRCHGAVAIHRASYPLPGPCRHYSRATACPITYVVTIARPITIIALVTAPSRLLCTLM